MILRTTTPEIRKDLALLARLQELTIGAENHSGMLFVLDVDDDTEVFISMRDGRSIGWAFLRVTRQIGIYVDAIWRRTGVGTSLMKALIAHAGSNVTAYPMDDGAVRFFELMSVHVVDLRTNPHAGIG